MRDLAKSEVSRTVNQSVPLMADSAAAAALFARTRAASAGRVDEDDVDSDDIVDERGPNNRSRKPIARSKTMLDRKFRQYQVLFVAFVERKEI